jgi:site-specific DNA-methyltransferase (adenine-specific)
VTPYYQDDLVTIYHGDCRDVVPELQDASVDVLLTDPPYGMAFGGFRGAEANVRADGARQGIRLVRQMFHETRPKMGKDAHAYVFCHWESWPDFYDAASPFIPIKSALIWWKNRGGMGDVELEYARDYEVILFGAHGRRPLTGRRDGSVLPNFAPMGNIAERLHPTEKPVPLLAFLIGKSAPERGTVLDPFMGSGSTLEAAKQLGRKAIGIEIEERYCEIAAQRCSQEVLGLAL